ncbi:hypothetical protein Rpal_2830 [Rhodopseudomonas palustris TIE-1]|nr:hypothetical protein Rpal_2830 [Rhodopseudomonas palustris TIE-1]
MMSVCLAHSAEVADPANPNESFAFEAFCQSDSEKIKSVSSIVKTGSIALPRAVGLAWRALRDCPEKNNGPFYGNGKLRDATESTIAYFFAATTARKRPLVAPMVWLEVRGYQLGPMSEQSGNSYRTLRPSGNFTILDKYSFFDHVLFATEYQRALVPLGGDDGSFSKAFSDAEIASMIEAMPVKEAAANEDQIKWRMRIDLPNCLGVPPLGLAVLAGRYNVVLNMLDKGADVNFDIPPMFDGIGILNELLEPVKTAEPAYQSLSSFKEPYACYRFDDNGFPVARISDPLKPYRDRLALVSFFDFFVALYRDSDSSQEALFKIAERTNRVSPSILLTLSDPKFELNFGSARTQGLARALIEKGADIHARDTNGLTLLRRVMNRGASPEAIQFISSIGGQL